jgi:hypothetical protein
MLDVSRDGTNGTYFLPIVSEVSAKESTRWWKIILLYEGSRSIDGRATAPHNFAPLLWNVCLQNERKKRHVYETNANECLRKETSEHEAFKLSDFYILQLVTRSLFGEVLKGGNTDRRHVFLTFRFESLFYIRF